MESLVGAGHPATSLDAENARSLGLALFTEAMTPWIGQHILGMGATQERHTGAHSAPFYRGPMKGTPVCLGPCDHPPSGSHLSDDLLCSGILKFFCFLEGAILSLALGFPRLFSLPGTLSVSWLTLHILRFQLNRHFFWKA